VSAASACASAAGSACTSASCDALRNPVTTTGPKLAPFGQLVGRIPAMGRAHRPMARMGASPAVRFARSGPRRPKGPPLAGRALPVLPASAGSSPRPGCTSSRYAAAFGALPGAGAGTYPDNRTATARSSCSRLSASACTSPPPPGRGQLHQLPAHRRPWHPHLVGDLQMEALTCFLRHCPPLQASRGGAFQHNKPPRFRADSG